MLSFRPRVLSSRTCLQWLSAVVLAMAAPLLSAQTTTAPYVLPYTMSTFAGPHAIYTAGAKCGNYVALDTMGDGCLASQVSVGGDPHDIRVDAKGNVYWLDDNGSNAVIHKIDGSTSQETVYAGSIVSPLPKPCSAASDTQGDNCPANDGMANANAGYAPKLAKGRGLAVAPNGDLYFADYNGNYDHKISASTGLYTVISGTGTSGNVDGAIGTSRVNGSRGIGVDAAGNVYVADTGNNILRKVVNGVTTTLTAQNAAKTISLQSNIPASQALLAAPEDVQCDSFGNIFIADTGTGSVRAIYVAGTLPGISNPVVGNIYTIAGGGTTTYTTSLGAVPATSISVGGSNRKIALDARNNLYMADSGNDVVWFVDATTGYIRVLAGNFAVAAGVAVGCPTQTDSVGDGCPGPLAGLYPSADMGTDPDNQGNLYITDAQGANPANSRLRKLLSGLNFPAVAAATSATQSIDIHFAVGDSPAATNPFTSSNTDFVIGTPACTPNNDGTQDCIVPVTFTPSKPGYDTATLTIQATTGGVTSYLLTGTGMASAVAIDPGNLTLVPATTKGAQNVASDASGNLYIADTANNRVLFYSVTTGATTTFAGTGTAGYTGDGSAASAATLKGPTAVAIDTTGSVYIADTGNNVIRKVTVTGVISKFAGGASAVCSAATDTLGNGCPASQATLSAPSGLAADKLGNVYISDTGNNLIRQVNVLGYISNFAGGATASTVCATAADTQGDSCSANQAFFSGPTALAYDETGSSILVADTGDNIVRSISIPNVITFGTANTVLFSPVTLIAGNGQAGNSVDASQTATKSQLSAPRGVSVDAARNVYIADTGNSAVRLVSSANGNISTIAGLLGASGTGNLPGSAADVQLNAPTSVAVTPSGLLYIADAGNNRVLADNRSQVSYNFGRLSPQTSSPTLTFTETNIGTSTATFATPASVNTGDTADFAFTVPTTNGCVNGFVLASGANCVVQGSFSPVAIAPYTATYTESGIAGIVSTPTITLTGTGALFTKTTSVATQSGTAQYGQATTLGVTVTPASCNTSAPSCVPTGTVRFIIDGTAAKPIALSATGTVSTSVAGLAVGSHTVGCTYSGDSYYGASTCATLTVPVTTATTTAVVTSTNNNQVQYPATSCSTVAAGTYKGDTSCAVNTLSATVVSSTTGVPTGTVTFYATSAGGSPVALGTSPVNSTTGVATLNLAYITDSNGMLVSDTSLAAGTYNLTCAYSGATNYSAANCAPFQFVVLPSPQSFTIDVRGCGYNNLYQAGTSTPGMGVACNGNPEVVNSSGIPVVSTAQGSTTDVTIFISPTTTATGTLTFSCSGMPQYSVCTFLPTSIPLTPGTTLPTPVYTDVTFWTDIQPGSITTPSAALHLPGFMGGGKAHLELAMLGWPVGLLGLAGIVSLRRRTRLASGLRLFGLLLVFVGTTLTFTGCGGPGTYTPALTPAGSYPITITIKGAGVTKTTQVIFQVGAPGAAGQE